MLSLLLLTSLLTRRKLFIFPKISSCLLPPPSILSTSSFLAHFYCLVQQSGLQAGLSGSIVRLQRSATVDLSTFPKDLAAICPWGALGYAPSRLFSSRRGPTCSTFVAICFSCSSRRRKNSGTECFYLPSVLMVHQ